MRIMSESSVFVVIALVAAQAAGASQVTLYEGEGFRGRAFTTTRPVADLQDRGFNDRASSLVVDSGDWIVCEDAGYGGRCVVVHQGAYDSLQRLGLNDRISSVRSADRHRRDYADAAEPLPAPNYEYRRRPNERVDEALVTSVRAVVGTPENRCWVERERVPERSSKNVGGAVVGAIIGGVIGHQIGRGTGQDIATAGGAIAGGVVGANAGRSRDGDEYRDIQHCENNPDRSPDYWDVTYEYRGVEHYVKMTAPPGRTIYVNRNGEPRQ